MSMARRGHTGTSMGGRIVRRKDLKAKNEAPPVDPATLSPDALARREAYQFEEVKRTERIEAASRRAAESQAERARLDEAEGKRSIDAGEAVRRRR